MLKKLYTTTQLAEELGVHINSIYNWKKDGLPTKMLGKTYRYDMEEVLEWMNGKESKE